MANMTFKASLLPNTDLGYSLGSDDKRWKINGYTLEDTYVKKSGDTMSGSLTIKRSSEPTFVLRNTSYGGEAANARVTLTMTDAGSQGLWSSGYFDGTNYTTSGKWLIVRQPNGDIVVNGNADTATKLKTARNINGTAFDGTIDITTAYWGTACNISISDSDASNTGTAISVDGSAAVTLKLPATIKATLKGNADTATKAVLDQNGLRIDTGYLKLTGGRMTGNITMRTNTSMSTGVTPSATTNFNRILWEDKDGYSTGGLGNRWYTDGVEAMEIYEAKRKSDGTYIYNQMALGFKSDDTPYVWLGLPATWRSALGLGSRATDNMTYFPYHEVTSLDANSTTSGIYSCKASITNAPVTNHGVLIDFHFVGTPFLIFMPDNVNYMYKRWYTSGAWTAWHIMNAAWA